MNYFDLPGFIDRILNMSPDISDIIFSVGRPPQVTLRGELAPAKIPGINLLSPYQTEVIALCILKNDRSHIRRLIQEGSVDISYSIPGKSRFRVNIFSQRGTYAIVMRVIRMEIPTIEKLQLPSQLAEVANEKNGIVLVTGPTGSGKSSTLAAIINKMNHEQAHHIITIEDPIEFLHPHKKSTVNQREIGQDSVSFALALRAALRQAPNVILVGEMRDMETTSIAMEAAETGHLVLSTLHTVDASKTIDRIIGIFPKNEEQQVRTRLAGTVRYIISQRLIPAKDGRGVVAAIEILKTNQRIRDYIERGESEGRSLLDAIQDGFLEGMQSFDQHILELIRSGRISVEDGIAYCSNRNNFMIKLREEDLLEDFVQSPDAD